MNRKTKILAESAVMIALATLLSLIKIWEMPQGGAVTLASMLPIILIGYRHGPKWGVLTGIAHSLLQMLIGFYAPPTKTLLAFVIVVLFDYVAAFGVLGLAGVFGRRFSAPAAAVGVGGGIAIFLRFCCHFFTGVVVWGSYAGVGESAWIYSLVYNGSYLGVEMVITLALACVVVRYLPKA